MTTHLRWDPPDRLSAEKVGPRQLRAPLNAIGPAASSALVICGNLNVTTQSEVVAALVEHGLYDAYAGSDDAFTCNANARCQRIDYISHSEAFSAEPLPVQRISARTPLPSVVQPSDHLAIVARLQWNDGV